MSSSEKQHRVLITGGGTGGHLYPAIAVIELLQQDPSVQEILYIGNQNKSEATLIPKMGIPFYGIKFEGLKKSWRLFIWPLLLLLASLKLILIFRLFKPTVIFATGGYVIAPVLLTALIMRIPYILHEPDAHPGKANRLFASGAQKITCGFEAAQSVFGRKSICTGNPVRSQFGQLSKVEAFQQLGLTHWDTTKKVILVMGGSQGAKKINDAILSCHQQLASQHAVQILHQTGEKLFTEARQFLDDKAPPSYYYMAPFFENMACVYAAADIVIGRSGAMSLSEIYASGLPSILIPYPYATADHQRKNAETSVRAGASEMILDKALTADKLYDALNLILSNTEKYQVMSQASHSLAKKYATQDIVALIKTV